MLLTDWLRRKLFGGRRVAPTATERVAEPPPLTRGHRVLNGEVLAIGNAPFWNFTTGCAAGMLVKAHTKSEARARVKHALGLDRLPAGTRCERVKP